MRISHRQQTDFSVKYIDILSMSGPKNHKFSCRNGRKNYGFIYVIHGSICYNFLDAELDEIIIRAGTLLYIPKGCAYYITFLEENTEHKTVQFDLSTGSLPDYLSKPQIIPMTNTKAIFETFFRQKDTHLFYRLSCLYHFLWQIDSYCSGLPTKYKRLQPALAALSETGTQQDHIAYYADLCGMSEVNFRRLFKEYTGKSPVEYRNDLRLEDAKNRIESGEYNVSEAAEAAGFTNLSFFSRLYKKKYGHTPKRS